MQCFGSEIQLISEIRYNGCTSGMHKQINQIRSACMNRVVKDCLQEQWTRINKHGKQRAIADSSTMYSRYTEAHLNGMYNYYRVHTADNNTSL